MVDAKTTVCCIIGDPVEHSLSPAMHNAAYEELGLNWVYVAFGVKDVENSVRGIRALGVRGASVTIPHKVEVMRHLDKLDPVAEWIGSVNTIVNDRGTLTGMNTDGAGAMKALTDAGVELKEKRALLVGSGGAARAVAITLGAKAGLASMEILGVIEDELKALCADVNDKAGTKCEWGMMDGDRLKRAMETAGLVIHCTPMDIVYNPRETKLIQDAAAAGCKVVHGFEMLLNQGVLQFEAWTKKPAPVHVMRKALEDWLDG